MKRIKILFLSVILMLFINIDNAKARECLKNFYGYEIQNVNIREFAIAVKTAVETYGGKDNYTPLKNVENAYIYADDDSTFFIRIYPASNNTNVFVVANTKYDVENNDVTQFLNKHGYKFGKLEDKKAFSEYQYDFYTLAREEKLGNFYISPDLVKPLKAGISTVNNKLSKYTQKTPAPKYVIDSEPIDLPCVDTTSHYDNEAKVALIRREYRLKEKTSKYIHAFEYILTNKNTSTASVTVTSDHVVNLVDVTAETMENMDKVDFVDMTCSLPPVIICTAGLSLIGSVPNWIRWAKLTKEATRFAHTLPKDYKLRPQGNMRVLVLKSKDSPKPLKFNLKFEDKTYDVVF